MRCTQFHILFTLSLCSVQWTSAALPLNYIIIWAPIWETPKIVVEFSSHTHTRPQSRTHDCTHASLRQNAENDEDNPISLGGVI